MSILLPFSSDVSALPLVYCRPWGGCHGPVRVIFFYSDNSESIGSEEARGRAACGCDMSGREGGREGGHGRGQSDRSIGSGGRRKGKSHAGPGRPTQSVYVATPKDGANSRAIYEYFTRVPKSQMPSLASNRMEAVGQQATSSVPDPKSAGAAPKSPSCTPAASNSQGDLVTAVAHAAGAALNSAAQVVSDGLMSLVANYTSGSDDEGEKETIDVDAHAVSAEEKRLQALRDKWVGKVWNGQQTEDIVLPDPMLHRIDEMIKLKTAKKKNVRTSWSSEDKVLIVDVYSALNSKHTKVSLCN